MNIIERNFYIFNYKFKILYLLRLKDYIAMVVWQNPLEHNRNRTMDPKTFSFMNRFCSFFIPNWCVSHITNICDKYGRFQSYPLSSILTGGRTNTSRSTLNLMTILKCILVVLLDEYLEMLISEWLTQCHQDIKK